MISSWPIAQPTRRRATTRWHALVALLLTAMLLPLVPSAPPAPVRSIVADSPAAPAVTILPATPAAPPYTLPAELAGKQEIVARRSAYSATFDMGGGSYALLADSVPIHYQDDQGAWQPINPAFAAVENGWLNRTNNVQTGLSSRGSSAKIGDASVGVGWEPNALLVAGPSGEAEVALPLPEDRAAPGRRSADGRTVRYLASWSDQRIQDQWQTRRGASEYAMRLPALPRVALADPQSLDLRVELHLRSGTSVLVGGRPAQLPLETREAIAFVGEHGQQLLLAPPRAYEQAQPDTTIPSSYALVATADPSVVELRVRTPWAWLAVAERQFPVVIDPVFQMRSPVQIKAPVYARVPTSLSQSHLQWLYNHGPGIGNFKDNGVRVVQRLLVRFDLQDPPNNGITPGFGQHTILPAGTQIDLATLVVAPTDHSHSDNASYLNANVLGYDLQDTANPSWWKDDAEPKIIPGPAALQLQTMSASDGAPATPVSWDVTAMAQRWLAQPNQNYGFMLRAENEGQDTDFTLCRPSPNNCGGFYFGENTWDDNALDATEDAIIKGGTPPSQAVPPSPSGGIRLIVRYHGPQLSEYFEDAQGVEHGGVGIDKPVPMPVSREPFYQANHDYIVAPAPDQAWRAVVARGLGQPANEPLSPDHPDAIQRPLSGTASLQIRDASERGEFDATAVAAKATYVMLHGGTNQVSQHALVKTTTGETAQPAGYDLRVQRARDTIAVPLNQTVSLTYDARSSVHPAEGWNSTSPFEFWNIELPPGSNSRVQITFPWLNLWDGSDALGNTVEPHYDAYYQLVRNFSATLFSGSGKDVQTAGEQAKSLDTNPNIPRNSGFLSFDLTPTTSHYALALAYNGPHVKLQTILCGQSGEFIGCGPVQSVDLGFSIGVRVTACDAASGLFPTKKGTCQLVKCPTITAPAAAHRTVAGLELWAEGGWNAEPGANAAHSVNGDVAPMIGGAGGGPHVAVVGGVISYDQAQNRVAFDSDSTVKLVNCEPSSAPPNPLREAFTVFDGAMLRAPDRPVLVPDPSAFGSSTLDAVWPANDSQDISDKAFSVDPAVGKATTTAKLRRGIRADNGTLGAELAFDVAWSLDVRGWPSLYDPGNAAISQFGATPPPAIASLILALGPALSLDIVNLDRSIAHPGGRDEQRIFSAVRAGQATISQPPQLGGASKPVQALILPRGEALPSDPPGAIASTMSFLDLRALDDAPAEPNWRRRWIMPDVHTNFPAGTVLLSQRGTLQVYSIDHPRANAASFTQPFSFDTFSGAVTVSLEPCDSSSTTDVVVVRGETQMTLPNIGDSSSPDSLIQASFKLCETSLRSVHMEFHSPVGVPIGSSGLSLTGLSGTVDIYEDHTTITFGLDFQTTDGGLLTGHGDVTIDTRGLFAFQGNAKILGAVDADGKLWVAWNPLDMGFEMNLSYGGWLSGFASAHMWKGQGWQHRYAWLPDNGETHIAAQFGAEIRIRKGQAFSWTFIDIPPFTTSFSIEIAFGQFCTSGDCTSYEWGVKGKFSVAGYDVGLYYGFSHGFDFILGNDDHTLIDQFGGASSAPLVADTPLIIAQAAAGSGAPRLAQVADADAPLEIRSGAPIVNGIATEKVDVHADAQQLLFGVGWKTGAPSIRLLNPHGDVAAAWSAGQISGNIAYSYAITQAFELDRNMALIGLKRPADTTANPWQGGWKIEIGNLHADESEEYQVIMFANQGGPGGVLANGGYVFTAPVSQLEAATGSYTIRWDVPQGTPDSTRISLYYSQTPPTNTPIPPQPGDPNDPNLPHGSIPVQQDIPIVRHVRFADGEYAWATRALASGSYLVYGVVDDGFNSFPSDTQLADPSNPCVAPSSGLPTTRAFRPDRFPGTVVFTSTGTIVISDTTPPAAPTGLALTPADGALLARWDRPPADELDTIAYVVHWHQDRPGQSPIDNQQRVTAVETPTLRLGGLTNGLPASVSVRAVDASENISAPSPEITAVPEGTSAPIPLAPTDFHLVSVTADSASFAWIASAGAPSYRLVYTEVTTQPVTAQLEAPGDATSATITGLRAGMTYQVRLSAVNSAGWRSASTDAISVVATSGVSSAGDGLPDDWAAFYHVAGAGGDPDADGVNNLQEFTNGTNPTAQDSDGDGFSDYEELHSQPPTNPFDRTTYGASVLQPRLALEQNDLTFRVDLSATTPVTPEIVNWSNIGGGNLVITATADSPWLSAQVVTSTIRVGVNRALLKPGFNAGIVRLAAAPGSDPLIGAPSCIRVRVWATGRGEQGPAGGTPCGADTYVERKYPHQSFGSSTKLEADADHEAWAFIRCQVPAGDKVKRVKLRLYVVESAPHGGRFYHVESDWSEDMTWRTRPTHLGKLIAELGPVKRGKYVEVDVTKALQANGTISLAIRTPSHEDVEYASREAGANRAPLLIIER